MPVSPYISQNSYISRPYSRANSSSYTPTTISTSSYGASKYFGGDTSPTSTTTTTTTTSGYKTGGYGKSKLPQVDEVSTSKPSGGYITGRYKSSDNIPESQTLLELRLKKSNSNSALLTGNTANIAKSFNKTDSRSPGSPYLHPTSKYATGRAGRPEEPKFCGKSGGVSIFASHYLSKVNKGREYRPREIDTRDINTTIKPNVTPGFDLHKDESYGLLTRASRHVVRLTIKREELDDPFTVKDKTIKTIAQRLIEKYTDKEKKPDPYEYVPRKRLYESNNQTKEQKPVAVEAAVTPTPSSIVTSSIASDTTANSASKEPTISTTSRKKSLAELRATMSPQSSFEDEGDAAFRLLRATSMAAKKKDLENPEEVKDAIIAAVLHPDVDIESDEEMKELVQEDKTKWTEWDKDSPEKLNIKNTEDHPLEGKNIVGQLKRFVKKQVSTKGPSKKKSSEKKNSRMSSKKSKKESKKCESQCDKDQLISSKKEGEVKPKLNLSQKEVPGEDDDDSVLSTELIFGGGSKSDKHKKSKEKIINSNEVADREPSQHEKNFSKKGDKKIESSLLSADLVYNNLTSDEENDSRPRTPAPIEKELNVTKEKVTEGEKVASNNDQPHKLENEKIKEKVVEKPASKIPKIKKKVKQAAVGEETTQVLPKIKVSRVGSPSDTALKGPTDVEEKVLDDFKKVRESDTFSGINKKISSKTSTTGNGIETSDHQLESTSSVGPKNSIPGKEIKSVRSEKSSTDDKKEKLSEEKSISDVSVELKASKKSRVVVVGEEGRRGNKDENAVKPELSQEGGISFADNHSVPEIHKERMKEEKKDEETDIKKKEEKKIERKEETDKKEKNDISKQSNSITKIDSLKHPQLNERKDINKKISSKKSSGLTKVKNEEKSKKESLKEKVELHETEKIKQEKASVIKTEKGEIKETTEKYDEVPEEKVDKDIDSEKESKQDEVQTDAVTGKKAIKRPRLVGPAPAPAPPPALQENKIGTAELMNARKVLKRPVKKIGVASAPEESPSQPTTPEDPTKKLWKRPLAQLVPLKEGDQFLQARNILKKPGKPKMPIEEKGEKPTGKLPEMQKKKFKKFVPAAQKDGGDKDDSSDEEGEGGGGGGAKKGERPKRPMKLKPASDQKIPSPPESPSGTAKLEGSGKDPKLSACQSADSGYGSSPSTPQPTQATPDVKSEEICTVCGTNCHKKCEKQMANLCGVNQKLLAEALSSVKKAGSTDGTSRTMASPTKSSSVVSGSESETTEEESETDTDTSDYFGLPEIRPPLQSKPKFKKYTIDDYLFIKVLGKGSYGKVMLAQQKDSENYFAVKCLKKDVVLEDNDVECTLIERKVLSLGTKHPYLCHLYCTFQTPSHLFFVMEYLTGGDLMFHIQHCGRFDEYRACFYAAEITSGLKFLHNKGIIYRDLKLDNILLDYQGHIRIADFGMCKLQVYLDRFADTFCGTPDYMAPEVIKGQHYNQCVDWWSFGVLLYEMLTGKSPFKGCDEDHLFWLICNDEPFFPKFLSREATDILKGLLDKDSNNRLGIPFSPYGEIKDHAFFKYVDWCKIERKEVETPYKPRLRHILDVQYFDRLFTKRQAAITPLDESILATMDQAAFRDFSYTNPNITD